MPTEESKTKSNRARPDVEDGHAPALEFAQPWLGQSSLAFSLTLTTLDAMQAALNSWRGLIDASRVAFRDQQDAMFTAMRTQVDSADSRADNEGSAMFMSPVVGAIKGYGQMTQAMISAQREAMRSLAQESRPH